MAFVLRAIAFPLTKCCRESGDQEETPARPPLPIYRSQISQTGVHSSGGLCNGEDSHAGQITCGSGDGGSAEYSAPFDLLDINLLAHILSQCGPQDLVSARAVNSEWRALADDVALDKFQQHWGLRSLGGTPRSTAALPGLGDGAFVRQRTCSSLDTLSSLAIACDTDVATLKQTNNLYSEHSLHSREHVFVPVADPRGRAGQFHYDLVIMRQYVIVGTEAATEAAPAEADSPSRREAQERQLAQLLSRSLRVDLQQATFYLRGAQGDIRAAIRLHEQDVRWDRNRPRNRC